MKQKLLNNLRLRAVWLVAMILCAVSGAWAENKAYYTLDTSKSTTSNNAYASSGTATVDGIEWSFEGNGTMNPWRLGGKNLDGVNRIVLTQTAMDAAISSVNLTVGGANNITVNSLTLVVASDDSFNDIIDEVEVDFESNSTITFEPTSGDSWAEDSYYKFVFNVSVSGNSNKFVEFSKVEFYEATGGGSQELTNSNFALTDAPVALSFDLYNNASAQVINYTTSSTGAVTIADNDYATFDIDEQEGTITVTPTAVTPSAQTITVNQAVDETYKAGSATFTLTITDSTPIPTHTATFSVNGANSTQDFEEGAAIAFPANPADVNGKTFVGWVAEAIDGTTNVAPNFVTSATMGKANVTYYAVFATVVSNVTNVTDVLTNDIIKGVENSYGDWNGKSITSTAVYAGNSAGSYNSIQLRSNNSNSGVITTTSGGTATKVVVKWNSNTVKGRTLNVYGSNSTYSAASNLYDAKTQGTLLGSIACGTNTELTIDGDYTFIGVRSSSGALYLDELSITWSSGSASVTDYCTNVAADTKLNSELSFAVTEVNANISEQFEAPTLNAAEGFNGTVEYESSDESVAQIMDGETGELRLLKEGTTTITATFAGNDDYKAGSASYTLTVIDNRIATTTTHENIVLDLSEVESLTQLSPVVKDAENNIIDCTYTDFPPKVSYEIVSDVNGLIGSIDNNSGEITLNKVVGTATIKASYNTFNVSNSYKPSECTFTITVESVQTISEVRTQGTGSVTTKGIVTSCSGTTAYIQDTEAAICVYGSALTVGDQVKVSGTLSTYKGLLEITSPTVTVLSQNNAVTPEVMTIAEINESENQGWLVKIEDATVTAINGQNTTIAQGDNTIVVRGITGVNIAVDDVITLTGNIGCYDAVQIANPTDVVVKVATPTFTPESSEVVAGSTVSISTTTADATIYYTTNGDEPTTGSTLYSDPITINADMTIKAIAVKDGMSNSNVASASYTIIVTPTITVSTNSIEATAAGTDDTVALTYANLTISDAKDFDIQYYDSEGEETDAPNWILADVAADNDDYVVSYMIGSNEGTEARTAYFKVYAMDNEMNFVYSNLVTVTQAGYVPTTTYTLANSITPGKRYIITNVTNGEGYAMGGQNQNNRAAVGINVNDGTIELETGSEVQEFVIYGSESNGFYFYDETEGGYLYAASSGSNYLKTQKTDNANGRWSIEFDGDKAATITAQGENTRNLMRYNSGSTLFSCYASGQKDIYLYESEEDAVVTNVKVQLNNKGFATYASDNTLDFLNADASFSAWQVTGVSGSTIQFEQIESTVASGKGIMLMGSANAEITINILPAGGSTLSTNKLVGITTATTVDDNEYFGLKGNEFVKVNAGTIPAGKAVLPASLAAGVKSFTFNFNGVPTGVNGFETVDAENARIFNLAGQRLSTPQKGLNIVNGKKVLVK